MNRTKYLLTADDVKDYLECSRDHAYKVIKKLNQELASMGYEVEAARCHANSSQKNFMVLKHRRKEEDYGL